MDRIERIKIFTKIIWRSFFLQAWWNFERLQNLGLLYALVPLLEKLYPDEKDRKKRMKFYEEYFNTNPIFFPILAGVLINMEEKLAKGEIGEERISNFKIRMMSTLGAIGDTFSWGGIRPLAAFCGIFAALISKPVVGLVVYLLIYDSFLFFLKIRGITLGYKYGDHIIDKIAARNPYRIAYTIILIDTILASAVFTYLLFISYESAIFSFAGIGAGIVIAFLLAILPSDLVTLTYFVILILGVKLWPVILKR